MWPIFRIVCISCYTLHAFHLYMLCTLRIAFTFIEVREFCTLAKWVCVCFELWSKSTKWHSTCCSKDSHFPHSKYLTGTCTSIIHMVSGRCLLEFIHITCIRENNIRRTFLSKLWPLEWWWIRQSCFDWSSVWEKLAWMRFVYRFIRTDEETIDID